MNVTEAIAHHARERPYAVAVIDGERIVHFGKLEHAIRRAVVALRGAGIAPGDVVAIAMPSSALHLVVVYALARLDAVQITIWPGNSASVSQSIAKKFGVRRIVTYGNSSPVPSVPEVPAEIEWLDSTEAPPGEAPLPDRSEVPWKIVLSSGSTGNPKAFMHTHAMELAGQSRFTPFEQVENGRFLQQIDMAYAYGLRLFMLALSHGFTVVLSSEVRTVQDFFDLLDRHRITHLSMTPSHAVPLVEKAPGDAIRFPHLKYLSVATGIAREQLRNDIASKLTPNLFIKYGANEVGHLTVAAPELWRSHPGTIGVPMPGVEIEIVDDAGEPLPKGEVGILRARCSGIPREYIDLPELSKKNFRAGWFYPGDMASFGADGELYFKGRIDDLMNFNGNKILPADIEEALLRHPAVVEAAAFPLPDPRHQDIPAAAVTVRTPVDPKELHKFSAAHLGFGGPQLIGIVPAMPKNAMGKVVKSELVRLFRQKFPTA